MANDITTGNPLFFDTAGATSAVTDPARLHSIVIYPTAASWDVIIGIDSTPTKVVFQAFGADKDSIVFEFPPNFTKPLYVTTLTNCKVVVYLR